MTLIVKTITRWIKGFILLFGIYIVLYGHLTPGGGFAGGVIVACSFVLITLAFGKEEAFKKINKAVASEMDSIGALMFLFIAWLGMYFGGTFFVNYIHKNLPGKDFHLFSAGIIPLCNIAIGIKVSCSLFMVFIILAVLRVVVTPDDLKMKMVQHRKKEQR